MLVVVLFTLNTGCSSVAENETRYYLLYNHSSVSTPAVSDISKRKQNGIKVTLPDYLNQPQLVIKLSRHKLHFSHFNHWAEPLKSGFYKSLISDLNSTDINNRYSYFNEVSTTDSTITINVEHFHITEHSTVILNGQYVHSDNSKQYQQFDLQLQLEKDGFEHAVAQLRKLVSQLALEIRSKKNTAID